MSTAALPMLSDEQAHQVYTWVDKHALSRPKRNIGRDFADAVCVAEILKFYFPSLVDLHNYVPSFSQRQKNENWSTMNQKVFRKLNLQVDPQDLKDIATAVPGAVERFLLVLMEKIPLVQEKIQARQQQQQQQHQLASSGRARSGSATGATGATTNVMTSATSRGPSPIGSARAVAGASGGAGRSSSNSHHTNVAGVNGELMNSARGHSQSNSMNDAAKDHEISHLRDSVRLLTAKIKQMEELLKLRDSKIRDLQDRVVELSS